MLTMSLTPPQIAIAGRVLEAVSRRPCAGITVEIVEIEDSPPEYRNRLSLKALQWGEQWEYLQERPDRKITRQDGSFYFLDLPAGKYQLKAVISERNTRYTTTSVSMEVSTNKTASSDIILNTTGVKGTISNGNSKGIAVVKVQIKDSQEITFSNQKGEYQLLGLETLESGKRDITLVFSALGYLTKFENIVLEKGKTKPKDIQLESIAKTETTI